MHKIDIVSGFLGSGKTTLIAKLLKESLGKEKVVLIENEFGEIGIDSGFLKEADIEITEMNSGCICCSLVGDFSEALKKVIHDIHPDRIIIEPSGVGKLSDVIQAVNAVALHENVSLNSAVCVVDVQKCKVYMKNFGEFFNDQLSSASLIVLSRTQLISEEKLLDVVSTLQKQNENAKMITTPWDQIDGDVILKAMEEEAWEKQVLEEMQHHECTCEHHHHDHHEEGCECIMNIIMVTNVVVGIIMNIIMLMKYLRVGE